MITNARVLQEDFVPREVVHRNAEVNHLSSALDPLLDGDHADHAFLFGPTGVGKTCIARYTLTQLREQLLDVRVQYVNCWQDYTRFRLYYRLLDGLDRAFDVHRQSTPTDELLDRLADDDDRPYVVVLDEVDQLEDTDALYDLHRLPHVTMILIANREAELFASLDDRVVSRLQSGARIQFDRYGTDELVAILDERAEKGLAPDAVTTDQLRRIADVAAGDARVAIGVLRSAARIAQREGHETVTDATVAEAIPDAQSELHRKAVDKLPQHQRTLYEILAEAGELSPGDLYERYETRVDDPKSERMLRNYLTKMVHYDLVEASGEKRGRTYRVVEGVDGA